MTSLNELSSDFKKNITALDAKYRPQFTVIQTEWEASIAAGAVLGLPWDTFTEKRTLLCKQYEAEFELLRAHYRAAFCLSHQAE